MVHFHRLSLSLPLIFVLATLVAAMTMSMGVHAAPASRDIGANPIKPPKHIMFARDVDSVVADDANLGDVEVAGFDNEVDEVDADEEEVVLAARDFDAVEDGEDDEDEDEDEVTLAARDIEDVDADEENEEDEDEDEDAASTLVARAPQAATNSNNKTAPVKKPTPTKIAKKPTTAAKKPTTASKNKAKQAAKKLPAKKVPAPRSMLANLLAAQRSISQTHKALLVLARDIVTARKQASAKKPAAPKKNNKAAGAPKSSATPKKDIPKVVGGPKKINPLPAATTKPKIQASTAPIRPN
ncbi:hypothetical protein DFJ77DRAFT_442502 [Powellomyces hirtus]|nr:hypothetical protein DFJ77DRAFT_442502 [Powellomyces hirtus]